MLGAQLDLPTATELDPVVREGLVALTGMANHANNLAGSFHRRDAINVLTVLYRAGYTLDLSAVYDWALANGRRCSWHLC